MNTRKMLKRFGIQTPPILMFFVTRSRALADLAWDPSGGTDSADTTLRWLLWFILICVIGSVWLFAKARMLRNYTSNESGWGIVVPFYGRYLEYKNYWDIKYYWINFGILLFGFALAVATWHVMHIPLLVWAVNTVRMRMKTMEAFGQNKLLGLLELLGLGIVLDCLCAFFPKQNQAEREKKADSLIKLPKYNIPDWIWAVLVLLLCISEIFLHQIHEDYEEKRRIQIVQRITEQVQTAVIATQTYAAGVTKTPSPYGFYVGDIITFGTYEQDQQSGADPIEWQVLAIENGRALLLSRYGLEARPFHDPLAEITWENSDLRTWLNGRFYNSSFTSSEKTRIQKVWNSNPGNSYYGHKGKNDTEDNIFLLSIDEAEKYLLTDSSRRCEATYHAQQNSASVNDSGYSVWWLRTPGVSNWCAASVENTGSIRNRGNYVSLETNVVRPALWINL